MFEKEVIFLLKGNAKRQPIKKRAIVSNGSIYLFFPVKDSLKGKDVPPKKKLENLGLLIIKNNLPILFVESMWLKRLIFCLCPKLNFPFKRQFSQNSTKLGCYYFSN
jgi:hypothetical protein